MGNRGSTDEEEQDLPQMETSEENKLMKAIQHNDKSMVRKIIVKNESKYHALNYAQPLDHIFETANHKMFKCILKCSTKLDLYFKIKKYNPLLAYLLFFKKEYYNLKLIELLIEKKADTNGRTPEGDTAMHLILSSKAIQSMKKFKKLFTLMMPHQPVVEEGEEEEEGEIDINSPRSLKYRNLRNWEGKNFYHVLCMNENINLEILKFCKENFRGYNFSTKDNFGNTVIHLLSKNPMCSVELLNYFLDEKVNIFAKNQINRTALHEMCSLKHPRIEIIKYLVGLKLDVDEVDHFEKNCVHHAVSKRNTELFHYLLGESKTVLTKGSTFLLDVVKSERNFEETIVTLIEKKADVTSFDALGGCAMFYECNKENPSFKIIDLLIKNGAVLNSKNDEMHPLFVVLKKENVNYEFAKLLIEHKSKIDGYTNSALLIESTRPKEVSYEFIEYLIEKKSNVNIKQGDVSLFELVCDKKDVKLAKILIRNHVDIFSIKTKNSQVKQSSLENKNLKIFNAIQDYMKNGTLWSKENHHEYSPSFKKATLCFLMSNNRMSRLKLSKSLQLRIIELLSWK